MPKQKQKSFEESLERLDEIINEIENGAPLDESVKLYKEGIGLAAALNDSLNSYEKEITELIKTSEGRFLEKTFNTEPSK